MTVPKRDSARFSARLRAACAGEWRAAHVEHPFVKAIGDGTLSLARFQYFMRQDYLFLIDYCRVLGIAAARCEDVESMSWWAKLLDETLNSEMALHRSFCDDFGLSAAELEGTEPAAATQAYGDYLLRVAYGSSVAVTAAALLPCQWGYGEIGRRLSRRMKAEPGSFHARWAAGYDSAEYHRLTAWLRRFVDRLGASASEQERALMTSAFREGVRHERAFWEQAWLSGGA